MLPRGRRAHPLALPSLAAELLCCPKFAVVQPSQIDSSMATAARSSSRLLATLISSALLLLLLSAWRAATTDATTYPGDAPTRASRRPRCTPWLFLFWANGGAALAPTLHALDVAARRLMAGGLRGRCLLSVAAVVEGQVDVDAH